MLRFATAPAEPSGTDWRLNVIRSNDRGNVVIVHDIEPTAKNPALAINAEGRVGLAYQQLTGNSGSPGWN